MNNSDATCMGSTQPSHKWVPLKQHWGRRKKVSWGSFNQGRAINTDELYHSKLRCRAAYGMEAGKKWVEKITLAQKHWIRLPITSHLSTPYWQRSSFSLDANHSSMLDIYLISRVSVAKRETTSNAWHLPSDSFLGCERQRIPPPENNHTNGYQDSHMSHKHWRLI